MLNMRVMGIKIETSWDDYLKKISTYLRSDLKSSDTSKIQLIISINFLFSKETK